MVIGTGFAPPRVMRVGVRKVLSSLLCCFVLGCAADSSGTFLSTLHTHSTAQGTNVGNAGPSKILKVWWDDRYFFCQFVGGEDSAFDIRIMGRTREETSPWEIVVEGPASKTLSVNTDGLPYVDYACQQIARLPEGVDQAQEEPRNGDSAIGSPEVGADL